MLRRKFFTRDSSPLGAKYYMGVLRTANSVTSSVGTGFSPDLVIAKRRNGSATSAWFSRARGALRRLITSTTGAENLDTNTLTAFTDTGFTLGADSTQTVNAPNAGTYVYWCFNEAAEFMDVVEFTGDGELNQILAHDLTIAPELAIGKSRTGTQLWPVLHKDAGGRDLVLNTGNGSTAAPGNSLITGHSITPQGWRGVTSGAGVYVAICKGSATSNRVAVSSDGENWVEYVITPMPITGVSTGLYGITFSTGLNKFVALGVQCSYTSPDGQTWTKGPDQAFSFGGGAEQCITSSPSLIVAIDDVSTRTSTDGLNWTLHSAALSTVQNCIYWAGGTFVTLPFSNNTTAHWSDDGLTWTPTAVPQSNRSWRHIAGSAAGVFMGVSVIAVSQPAERTNAMIRSIDFGRTWQTMTIATIQSWGGVAYGDGVWLYGGADTNNADDQSNIINVSFDNGQTWSARALIATAYWMYWTHGDQGFVGFSFAVDPNIMAHVEIESGSPWIKNPLPLTIDVGASFNLLDAECEIALFASKLKVSKVGVYVGNGGNQNIDCGFDTPARFVLIKRQNASGNWYVWDSVRGINTGTNDPYLILNSANAEAGTDNALEPFATGFAVNQSVGTTINASGGSYIYLAIA